MVQVDVVAAVGTEVAILAVTGLVVTVAVFWVAVTGVTSLVLLWLPTLYSL